MISGMVDMVREEGLRSLLKGLSTGVMRATVYGTLRIGLYEPIRNLLHRDATASPGFAVKAAAAMCSGALSAAFTNPMEVLKVRQQASVAHVLSPLQALRVVLRGPGGVRALWNGCAPAVQRAALLTAGQMATYDHVKMLLRESTSLRHDGWALQVCASMAAGLVSTTLTAPFDVLKTRLMNGHSAAGAAATATATAAAAAAAGGSGGSGGVGAMLRGGSLGSFVAIAREEGLRALFKGWVPTYVRQGPQTLLILLVLEQTRALLGLRAV